MVGTSLTLLCPPYDFDFVIARNAATGEQKNNIENYRGARHAGAEVEFCEAFLLLCGGVHRDVTGRHRVRANRRHDPVQRQDPHRRQGLRHAAGRGDRRWQDPRDRRFGRDEEARRQDRKADRSRRPHRDSRTDRRTHPRHPRRADLRHRGKLDRRADAERRAGKDRSGRKVAEAGILDRRRRRLDRGAVCREAPADTGGGRGHCAGQSRLHPASL